MRQKFFHQNSCQIPNLLVSHIVTIYYLLHFSSDFPHNISFIPVDFKKILDDFRQNLDSSGEIGKVSFYSLFIIYALAIVVGLCGNILIVTTVLGRKRYSEPELKILFKIVLGPRTSLTSNPLTSSIISHIHSRRKQFLKLTSITRK